MFVCECTLVYAPRDSLAPLEGHFSYNVHPRVHQGERETCTGTAPPDVKALWVRGKSLLLDLRPARTDLV